MSIEKKKGNVSLLSDKKMFSDDIRPTNIINSPTKTKEVIKDLELDLDETLNELDKNLNYLDSTRSPISR